MYLLKCVLIPGLEGLFVQPRLAAANLCRGREGPRKPQGPYGLIVKIGKKHEQWEINLI